MKNIKTIKKNIVNMPSARFGKSFLETITRNILFRDKSGKNDNDIADEIECKGCRIVKKIKTNSNNIYEYLINEDPLKDKVFLTKKEWIDSNQKGLIQYIREEHFKTLYYTIFLDDGAYVCRMNYDDLSNFKLHDKEKGHAKTFDFTGKEFFDNHWENHGLMKLDWDSILRLVK